LLIKTLRAQNIASQVVECHLQVMALHDGSSHQTP
jgi:hypothetical protein